ncbi:MAG: killer suppression protein HigA [Gammaproteobacteria bacterium]|nr:killer suppression protein HigA [Gammaproteobacteria bacterium]
MTHKRLGSKCAKKLQKTLMRLNAINELGGTSFGNPHPLKGNKKDQFSISLDGGYRLVFKALEPIPKAKDGSTDWQKVKKINIIFIGDYHA